MKTKRVILNLMTEEELKDEIRSGRWSYDDIIALYDGRELMQQIIANSDNC